MASFLCKLSATTGPVVSSRTRPSSGWSTSVVAFVVASSKSIIMTGQVPIIPMVASSSSAAAPITAPTTVPVEVSASGRRFYSKVNTTTNKTSADNNNNTALEILQKLSRRIQTEPPSSTEYFVTRRQRRSGGSSSSSSSSSSSEKKRRMVELATDFCTRYENLPPIQIFNYDDQHHNDTTSVNVDDDDDNSNNNNNIYDSSHYCERTSVLLFLACKCRPSETSIMDAIHHYQNTMSTTTTTTTSSSCNSSNSHDAATTGPKRHWDHLVLEELRRSVTPPYEEIINFILKQNSVTGMKFLVTLREDLSYVNSFIKRQGEPSSSSSNDNSITNFSQEFKYFDSYLKNVFKTWFTPGMMELRRIEYDKTPASIIETIATKEQVHPMRSLDDLRSRLGQGRRVFGLFHPLLPDVPLIFVHVALQQEIPSKMQDVMIENKKKKKRKSNTPQTSSTSSSSSSPSNSEQSPRVACFYSISNGQRALSGLGLGEYLIKQATQELKRELPSLQTFVTLSPIPRFRKWLETKLNLQDLHDCYNDDGENPFFDETILSDDEKQNLIDCGLLPSVDRINGDGSGSNSISWGSFWRLLTEEIDFSTQLEPNSSHESESTPLDGLDDRQRAVLKSILTKLTTRYLCCEKHHGRPLDAVCNFHVGNGAIVHRVNPIADPSRRGLESSFGMMVNYLYDLETVNDNQASFEYDYSIPVSPEVQECIDRIKR